MIYEDNLKEAKGVLRELRPKLKGMKGGVFISAYSNGREQGLTFRFYRANVCVLTAMVSEARGSDEIVVYAKTRGPGGRTAYATDLTDEMYAGCTCFPPMGHKKAAAHIVKLLKKS